MWHLEKQNVGRRINSRRSLVETTSKRKERFTSKFLLTFCKFVIQFLSENYFQGKIQGLKKSASKGDKKKKKEITDEIAKLEADLNEKHEKELAELKSNSSIAEPAPSEKVDEITETLEDTNLTETKKVSKAQKRRDKKAEKAKERLEDIERQEEENKKGLRHLETEKIKEILNSRGLQINEIPSDGDCLFAGISHQLNGDLRVPDLRKMVADTLMQNKSK